jgi:phage terminase large subunit
VLQELQTQSSVTADQKPYRPYGGAREIFYAQDAEILFDGPAGTGKTRAICEKSHYLAQRVSNIRILWLRKTRVSMTESVLVTFEQHVLPTGHKFTRGIHRRQRAAYSYPNGSEIVLGGLDNVDRIMSTEYDMVCVFEATEITQDDWEKLSSRLRNYKLPFQQQIADCNPAHPQHWLIVRANDGRMRRVLSRHEDNPTIRQEYLDKLNNLSGHRRARLYLGLWQAAEGLVYPEMDSCFCDPIDPPIGGFYGGMDFGYNDPFVALAATIYQGEDKRQHIYIYYERYLSKHLMDAHAGAVPTEPIYYADPSRPDSIQEMRRAGIRCVPAMNDILIGINAVNARIDSGTLHISNDCRALIAESQAYHYPEDKATEKPIDEFNHAMDALRYLVMGVDKGKVARMREAAG